MDMGNGEDAIGALEHALIKAWDALDESIIESCFESMERRRDAIIVAKGWRTKY